ncbi:MAG TPA: Flp pilus assembly protein CpaB [Xanthobacteraceae bacterium]|nr:Flp pilus assembly protein CpaB [Xanthobacteraceae bacterium]
MRASTVIMIAFAAVFGLLAVFVAQSWLNHQASERMKTLEAQQKKPAAVQTIVVASRPLRFGNELSSSTLREIEWPQGALPPGAFATIRELTSGGKRVVLSAIEANEPVLGWKITGPGQRATLSAVLHEGMKAVTVRVNDVEGVAGFVLPGDRVDVVLTRQTEKNSATTDVVMQNARVLAIDQVADERTDKPAVVKAVTLEVDLVDAQKLSLASQVGTLSLALRKAGEVDASTTRPVTLADLLDSKSSGTGMQTTVSVIRQATKTVYSVPREGMDGDATARLGQRRTSRDVGM